MVRRGLGSIRQDLNVSIACGDRVEIKGCQDLDWIPKIIRLEMARQLHFYRLANTLRLEAGLPVLPPDRRQDSTPVENRVSASAKSRLPITIQNMTSEFETCDSAMVKKALESGAVVKGISLPGFANKLGTKEVDKNGAQMPRLGREFASAAKLAGVAGIFHSDELPAYGISSIEVERVREALNLSEKDAFILCLAPDWQADLALESVVNRARMAYHRIPQEVRNVVIRKGSPEDGTTTAMRPLPGGARMYPETDVPVLRIEGDYWNTISENLPMNRSERFTRLEKFKISSNQIEALLGSELDDIFVIGVEGGLHDCPSLPAKAWASIILDNTRSDIAKAVNIVEKAVDWSILTLTVHAREEGIITRDGLIPMAALLITEGPTLGEAEFETRLSWFANRAEKEGFTPADTSAVEDAVDAILAERADFVAERGMEAVGPLMGMVMGKLGGAADGKIVSQVLREKIQKLT
jgi:glutamyl-tRNA(Gln) amidotransferase subunit E